MQLAPRRKHSDAFSLLEVMIALAIFFMCCFAILGLVAQSLRQARNLQPIQIDPMAALAELSLTNRLTEGKLPPEIIANFEQMYPGFTIDGEIYEVATNGLFRVDFILGGMNESKAVTVSQSSALLFRPMSQRQPFSGIRR